MFYDERVCLTVIRNWRGALPALNGPLRRTRIMHCALASLTPCARTSVALDTSPFCASATTTITEPSSFGFDCNAWFAHCRRRGRSIAIARRSSGVALLASVAMFAVGVAIGRATAPHAARAPHDMPGVRPIPIIDVTLAAGVVIAIDGALVALVDTLGERVAIESVGATSDDDALGVAFTLALGAPVLDAITPSLVAFARHASSLTPSAAAITASHASRFIGSC
jgi:hypothetical protein